MIPPLLRVLAERAHKIMLYVGGALVDLEGLELIEPHGEALKILSPRGLANYDQLLASGFRPDREEVQAALETAASLVPGGVELGEDMVELICSLDEIKARFEPAA